MDVVPYLTPCPFCGSRMILVLDLSLRCTRCGAMGPFANSVKQAIILWNERKPKTDSTPETKKTDDQPLNKSASEEGND